MSPFAIFVIVLTLGYVLYYAAMITIELTGKQKSEAAKEETIATDGISDTCASDDIVPRNVIENADTGGFSFSSPEPVISEPIEIAEADNEESLSAQTAAKEGTTVEEAVEDEITADAEGSRNVKKLPEEGRLSEEQPSEDNAPSEETKKKAEEEEPFPGIEYYEDKLEVDTDKKDFDVNDAFDPDLMTPKYGVTKLVEPPVSDETKEKANMVNASLLSVVSKGNQMDSFDLTRVIREQRAGQFNIETHDEVTNY